MRTGTAPCSWIPNQVWDDGLPGPSVPRRIRVREQPDRADLPGHADNARIGDRPLHRRARRLEIAVGANLPAVARMDGERADRKGRAEARLRAGHPLALAAEIRGTIEDDLAGHVVRA